MLNEIILHQKNEDTNVDTIFSKEHFLVLEKGNSIIKVNSKIKKFISYKKLKSLQLCDNMCNI